MLAFYFFGLFGSLLLTTGVVVSFCELLGWGVLTWVCRGLGLGDIVFGFWGFYLFWCLRGLFRVFGGFALLILCFVFGWLFVFVGLSF